MKKIIILLLLIPVSVFSFSVEYVDRVDCGEIEDVWGCAYLKEDKIKINNSLNDFWREFVLYHELCHFAIYRIGLKLDYYLEEELCNEIAWYFMYKNIGIEREIKIEL